MNVSMLNSYAEDTGPDGFALVSLDYGELLVAQSEMVERGEKCSIVVRKIRALGVTFSVFVLINREK